MNKDYTILIHKVLSGLADQSEKSELDEWIIKDPENRREFESFKLLWELSEIPDSVISDQAKQEADRFESTVIMLRKKDSALRKKDSAIRGLRRKVITLISILVLSAGVVAILFLNQPESNLHQSLSVNFENKQREVMLPDSSVVFLNRESSLCYEGHPDSRKVWLKGEGFFNISKDTKRTFYVFAQYAVVSVRGTSFTVNASTENHLEVCVVSGSVEVSYEGNAVQLAPGEKAILSQKHIAKEINRDPNFNAWYTGHYTFENVSLDGMIHFIEKEYNVKVITPSSNILACRFTGEFTEATIEEVLETLAFTFHLDYKILKTDTFELTGKGCG